MAFEHYLLEDTAGIQNLVQNMRRVAVLGIKTEAQSEQPAFYVPKYLASMGLDVIPVPVYFPEATEILGRKVYRRVQDVQGPIDVVNVFRRPEHLELHVEDILAKAPRAVWLQLGISHPQVAQRLAEAGIYVVQNRCLLVEHQRYA